jgi:hypothetical protein
MDIPSCKLFIITSNPAANPAASSELIALYPLLDIEKEIKTIENIAKNTNNVKINISIYENILAEDFFDIMSKNPDIVHFIGHSDSKTLIMYDGKSINSLFFAQIINSYNIRIIILNVHIIPELVELLEMCNNNKYSVISHHRSICDDGFNFVKTFYTELTCNKSVYNSFFSIKKI